MFAAQPPMPRGGDTPPDQASGGTRGRLVAAASQLLAEGGAGAVTLRAVGERAGVSRSAPYRHFQDKDGLLAAVLVEAFRQFFQDMTIEMSATPTAVPEALRRGFRAYIRFGLARPEHYLLMFGERLAGVDTSVDKTALAEVAPAGLAHFQDVIAQGQRTGEVRPGDASDMTILTWSALHGLVTFALSGHFAAKGVDTEEALERMVAELVASLEP